MYLLSKRYMPKDFTADFWEKEENFDISPEGAFDFYRFDTTIFINANLQQLFCQQKDTIKDALVQNIELHTLGHLSAIEKFADIANGNSDCPLKISIDLCFGGEIYNSLRGKNKYKERWVFEAHFRFEDPSHHTLGQDIPIRADAIQKYNSIKNVDDLIAELQVRLDSCHNSINSDINFLKPISENSLPPSYNCKYGKYVKQPRNIPMPYRSPSLTPAHESQKSQKQLERKAQHEEVPDGDPASSMVTKCVGSATRCFGVLSFTDSVDQINELYKEFKQEKKPGPNGYSWLYELRRQRLELAVQDLRREDPDRFSEWKTTNNGKSYKALRG